MSPGVTRRSRKQDAVVALSAVGEVGGEVDQRGPKKLKDET